MQSSVMVRVGVPQRGGGLVKAARAAGHPVLFSANAFMQKKEGRVVRVALPDVDQFAGLDAALDSAGYVAAKRYNGYPWSVEDYLDLAQAYSWAWYSSMDLCVEPDIAGSNIEVMFRLAETCRLYSEVRRGALDRGMAEPMPILQGWEAEHYLWCIDHLPVMAWPRLIGVGSMCCREVHGPSGVLSIVEALDKELPAGVKFHLFGVKGHALTYLAGHPRIASVDSMAWDTAARRAHPTGRTVEVRTRFMFDWAAKNQSLANGRARHFDQPLFHAPIEPVSADLANWLDLVASNEIDARTAAAACFHGWIGQ